MTETKPRRLNTMPPPRAASPHVTGLASSSPPPRHSLFSNFSMVAFAGLTSDAKTSFILCKLGMSPYLLFASTLANACKSLDSFEYNKEINQIACNCKSSFLAAADDGGDVKIIDISQKCLYKTLRAGHTSICSSVQFLPWRSWEVISGGLDSKLVMWDFSKGRLHKIVDFALHDNNGGSTGRCFNPAFIHAIVVPDIDMLDKSGKICTVARGDGIVDVIDIGSELAVIKSKTSSGTQRGSQHRSKNRSRTTDTENSELNGRKRLHLDYSFGGHTAALSCVEFSLFGEGGKFIISGRNDKSIKVWDRSRHLDTEQTSSSTNVLQLNINLSKKVNWLCTTPTDTENLVVCDRTKVVKVYSVS